MNHIDNTIPDTIDQVQDSDHQPAQTTSEEIIALFARLNPQDVEHFYQSYRLWSIQPRIQNLHREIAELQQAITHNAELMDECRPSPLALAILSQFQSNGVNDLDLLDRMLEHGDDWLDHTLRLLEQCEHLDIIHGNYTEWCEHALEGAYDWIGSMSEEDDTSVASTEAVLSSPEDAFDESTEQLFLQKLLSEEEEINQPSDSVEQPASDTQPEERTNDIISTELPDSVEALPDEAEQPTMSQILPDETALPIMSQAAQEEDEEAQTAEDAQAATISDTNASSAEEPIFLPAIETERSHEEENVAEFAAARNEASDVIEVSEAEDEANETIQQESHTTEIISSLIDEALETETTDEADLADRAQNTPDTETSAITESVASAEMAAIEVEPNEPVVAEPVETDETTIAELTEQEPAEELAVSSQDSTPVQEKPAVEKIEPAALEPMPEPANIVSVSEQLNEDIIEGEPQDTASKVPDSLASIVIDEEQQPIASTVEAEEIAAQSTTPTTEAPSATEQPENTQADTTDETTITQEAEDMTLNQELSPEAGSEETTAEELSQQEQDEDHSKGDTDDDQAIEQPDSVFSPIMHVIAYKTTVSSGDEDGYGRGEEDTIAIPKISFPISRVTPAIVQEDTQQIIPTVATDQRFTPKEEPAFIEATTIPNLPAVIPAMAIQVPQPETPAQFKEQTEATTIPGRQTEPDASSYTQSTTNHYPTPIWQEYSTNISNQPAPQVLPEPHPGFFRRLWLWFLAWLKG
jgi:hypothetical protein